ncbi:hypothetical protein CCACVL1_06638 [Corchorus capsularis]|uniref:Aminotransferase-like plant mobile domain-containing protein n=1 Tax=Corchorus capsularis TaxID=210143 RepID=A0A1R3JE49_COCAP|nr:hypothetical protein CCACVL1_06638 [Corchorus capsularis]
MATTHSGAPPRVSNSKKRHVKPKVDDGPAHKKKKSHHSSKSFGKSWESLRRAYLKHDKVLDNHIFKVIWAEVNDVNEKAYIPPDSVLKLCFDKGAVPPSKVKFMGTRNIREWNDWVSEILSNEKYEKTLKSAGVLDAVRVTTKLLHIQDLKSDKVDAWCAILSRWSTYSHTMITTWGEFTFTLEDVSALLHLPMVYDSEENLDNVENPFDEDALKKGDRKVLSELGKAIRHGGKPRTITSYVKTCRDESETELQPFQLQCFLLFWLARFVFPGNPEKGISAMLIPLAIHISKGLQLPLGPLYLGSLYTRLDLLHEKIKTSMGAFEVVAFLDLPFIQMCLWERFPLAAPNCNRCPSDSSYQRFRAWAWYDCKIKSKVSLLSVLDKPDKFCHRPYTCLLEGYGDPSRYPVDSSIPSEHMRAWVFTQRLPAVIEVSDKAKKFSWLTKFYSPFRVAVQFGYDQVAPHKHVVDSKYTFMHCLTSFSAQRLPKSNYLIPSARRLGHYSCGWRFFYEKCFDMWSKYALHDPSLRQSWLAPALPLEDISLRKIQAPKPPKKKKVGKKVPGHKDAPSTVAHKGAAIGVTSPCHSDVGIIRDPTTETTTLPPKDAGAASLPTTGITSFPSDDAGVASPRHDDIDGDGDVEIVSEVRRKVTYVEDNDSDSRSEERERSSDEDHESEGESGSDDENEEESRRASDHGESEDENDGASHNSSDDDHSQDDDEPEIDAVALKRDRVRLTSSSPRDGRVRLTSSSPQGGSMRLTSSSPRDSRVRPTSSSPGAGCNTSGATPATPRTSPPPASSVDEMSFDQSVAGFHNFPVKAMYVAPLKEAELRGGKFWESTILESEAIIAQFLDQIGEFVLKAQAPSNLSVDDLEAMRKTYDDCGKIGFDLNFMQGAREQIQNVIVGMKGNPEIELAQITEDLKALDAEKKKLNEAWNKVQRQVNRLEAKQNNLAPIRDSLEAFHQGRSFFPPP